MEIFHNRKITTSPEKDIQLELRGLMMVYSLTWSGCPHLVAEFGRVGGVNPCSSARVESRRAVILWPTHVGAVGAQHVWV